MRLLKYMPVKIRSAIEEEIVKVRYNLTLDKLITYILIISLVLSFIIILFFRNQIKLAPNFALALIGYFIISYFISLLISIFYFYTSFTIKKFKKRLELEFVLADYLQLVAANLNAGMPIDQALWYAVRERFGVLAEEVEIVARKVMGGVDLEDALIGFAKSYDSDILKKSIILLIEGLRSGGELASLVNKIAWNIKETQLLEKEISSETTTYSIFVSFASLLAAPALYALAHRIIIIMTDVTSKIDVGSGIGALTPIPLSIGVQTILPQDFKIFSLVNLFLTSTISAIIISKIRKGSVKAGVKLIPFFIVTSMLLFLLFIVILGQIFKGLII